MESIRDPFFLLWFTWAQLTLSLDHRWLEVTKNHHLKGHVNSLSHSRSPKSSALQKLPVFFVVYFIYFISLTAELTVFFLNILF